VRAGEDPDPAGASAATLAEIGERGLIARLRRRLPPPGPEVLLGIGDDAAAGAWSAEILLLTTDTLRAMARLVTDQTGTPVHRIGEVRPAGEGVRFLDRHGRPHVADPGLDHFR
jgi:thiamine monophosphate kinase